VDSFERLATAPFLTLSLHAAAAAGWHDAGDVQSVKTFGTQLSLLVIPIDTGFGYHMRL
jgi:hypothetical protein